MKREIHTLRRLMKAFDRSLRRLGPMLSASANTGLRPVAARRRPRLSRAGRSALRLQGRYMGYVRQLKQQHKAAVKKIRAAKGVQAAIQRARKLVERKRAA